MSTLKRGMDLVIIETTRFGTLELLEDEILEFPSGILGFEEYKGYVILEIRKDGMFRCLQSTDDPDIAFVIIEPAVFWPDYQVQVEADVLAELGAIEDPGDVVIYAIVTVPRDVTQMTANLQAPVVINRKTRRGKQVVLTDGKYHTRHPILAQRAGQEQRKTG
ncbi:MAG: flagellar assembly protein FliW [Firmicutes bacterium]|nr:flagellar assembly protein FliW [Bacillota bacterium]